MDRVLERNVLQQEERTRTEIPRPALRGRLGVRYEVRRLYERTDARGVADPPRPALEVQEFATAAVERELPLPVVDRLVSLFEELAARIVLGRADVGATSGGRKQPLGKTPTTISLYAMLKGGNTVITIGTFLSSSINSFMYNFK